MTPERFRQIRNLFEAALERPPAGREEFVCEAAQSDDDLRTQVERMLSAHDRTVTFIDGSIAAPVDLRTDPRRLEGRHLGPYEILREIGRGGMGTVYLARRADGLFQQQVAIKVVTPETAGREVIQRFEQERAILASLEHPNIARLFDGGSTEDGWPYFVMEYVEGKPIDEWCDERKLNVSERVRLFRTVCAAVHHAHQHRVIHRDLKPGNILVSGDGVVKLLDFGIAKLVRVDVEEKTALATRTGMLLMTPEYASPEQMRAEEISPLTDLYSLGVILYELLTGRAPYRLKSRIFHEIVRVVCEQPPTRPSSVVTEPEQLPAEGGKTITVAPGLLSQSREGTPSDLKRRLIGDLDGVLLKTLEKDPQRRYRSVEQFSSDLERHLEGRTVMVEQPGRLVEVARLAGRHRLLLVGAASVMAALLLGGIRVEAGGIEVILAALAMLGLWHVATDRTIGARISEAIYGMGPMLAVFTFVGGVAVFGIASSFYPALALGAGFRYAFVGVVILIAVYLGTPLVAWLFRDRWGGMLLASVRLDGTNSWVAFLNLPLQMWSMRRSSLGSEDTVARFAIIALFLVAALYLWTLARTFEVRERGLILGGRLISWLDIEGYEWESFASPQDLVVFSLKPEKVMLRLRVRRLFPLLPPPRVKVPPERQEEVEAILKQHLSEWPQGCR